MNGKGRVDSRACEFRMQITQLLMIHSHCSTAPLRNALAIAINKQNGVAEANQMHSYLQEHSFRMWYLNNFG